MSDRLDELIDLLADAVADRVAARLADRVAPARSAIGLVDAAGLAYELGVSRSYVYEHADELGAVRLGSGARARLRFDVEASRQAFACSGSESSQADNTSAGGRTPGPAESRRHHLPHGLPERGSAEPGSVLSIRARTQGG